MVKQKFCCRCIILFCKKNLCLLQPSKKTASRKKNNSRKGVSTSASPPEKINWVLSGPGGLYMECFHGWVYCSWISESKNGLRHSSQPFKTGIFNAQFWGITVLTELSSHNGIINLLLSLPIVAYSSTHSCVLLILGNSWKFNNLLTKFLGIQFL